MVLGLPDPDPSIIKQSSKKNFDSYCFVTPFRLSIIITTKVGQKSFVLKTYGGLQDEQKIAAVVVLNKNKKVISLALSYQAKIPYSWFCFTPAYGKDFIPKKKM
jgi:hypothetical protein